MSLLGEIGYSNDQKGQKETQREGPSAHWGVIQDFHFPFQLGASIHPITCARHPALVRYLASGLTCTFG